nr:reverse transcriptase domain-containing protein [Tanacetum cinerariifolium]
MNAIASSLYHSIHPSGTPPLLPISTPSTSHRAGIPEADTPPQNRPLLATPRSGYVETRLRDTKRRMMAALELVKLRVSYQVNVCTRESSEFYTRHHDAQKDRAAVRAEIEVLRSERLAYEQERQAADDFAVQHIMRTQALEAGARIDTLEDAGCRYHCAKRIIQIMAKTRREQTIPPTNPNNPNNMTPEAVQTMIDQALLRNSGSEDGSHIGLTRWIKKMESIFNISRCAVENQVKFATKVKKLEIELWNIKVRDNDIPAYTNRFQELALICTKFVSNKTEKVDKYISGLPDNIYGNVKSLKPKTLNETIELANDLMDQKLQRNGNTAGNRDSNVVTDLMPVELASFDAIIGMDWLRRHHVVIMCDEKLVRVPFRNETLVFCGAESYIERESRLMVISCSKVQENRAKGCHVFLAQISATKEDDKPERKQVKDVPIIQDFPEVLPEDLPGLPPARPIEFQIDLIPGAAPVAREPYRLAPSEMKELSEQLQELSD